MEISLIGYGAWGIYVSNFSAEQLGEALNHTRVDTIQPKYNMIDRSIEKKLVPFRVDRRVSIVVITESDLSKYLIKIRIAKNQIGLQHLNSYFCPPGSSRLAHHGNPYF